mmetsp:Transcript_33098/g.93681  ORF Transcript_33098/g.93681 Transcript_33098/m.93681 type:complete len:281 (+) Transcript_33098:631-1473(+)
MHLSDEVEKRVPRLHVQIWKPIGIQVIDLFGLVDLNGQLCAASCMPHPVLHAAKDGVPLRPTGHSTVEGGAGIWHGRHSAVGVSKLAREVKGQWIVVAGAGCDLAGWVAGIHGVADHQGPAVEVEGKHKVTLRMPSHDVQDLGWQAVHLAVLGGSGGPQEREPPVEILASGIPARPAVASVGVHGWQDVDRGLLEQRGNPKVIGGLIPAAQLPCQPQQELLSRAFVPVHVGCQLHLGDQVGGRPCPLGLGTNLDCLHWQAEFAEPHFICPGKTRCALALK